MICRPPTWRCGIGDGGGGAYIGMQIERSAQQGVIAIHPLVYRLDFVFGKLFLRAVSTFCGFAVIPVRSHFFLRYYTSLTETRLNPFRVWGKQGVVIGDIPKATRPPGYTIQNIVSYLVLRNLTMGMALSNNGRKYSHTIQYTRL